MATSTTPAIGIKGTKTNEVSIPFENMIDERIQLSSTWSSSSHSSSWSSSSSFTSDEQEIKISHVEDTLATHNNECSNLNSPNDVISSDDDDKEEKNIKNVNVGRENRFDRIPTRNCTNCSIGSLSNKKSNNNKQQQSMKDSKVEEKIIKRKHHQQHNKKSHHYYKGKSNIEPPFLILVFKVGTIIACLFGITYTIISYNQILVKETFFDRTTNNNVLRNNNKQRNNNNEVALNDGAFTNNNIDDRQIIPDTWKYKTLLTFKAGNNTILNIINTVEMSNVTGINNNMSIVSLDSTIDLL